MIVAFSVTPLGVGEDVADYVADAVRVVRASGLPNRTDAMFTSIEGEWDEVMAVVKQAVDAVAAQAPRVSVTLKADIRPGVTGALQGKVDALERAAAGTWRAPRFERMGDWLLRAAEGFTGRANSALAAGDPGRPLPDAVDSVVAWYAGLGQRAMIAVPSAMTGPGGELDRLLDERGWSRR